ncbi:VWA domain-containing protein [Prevotella veroralis]|uniref:VWA domain-containing protein n=1 Tax=Prevotella veroralis TaxID=28137 RepID=UPI000366620A|nr:VWA domain-containing protein [Prevotella veroralis]
MFRFDNPTYLWLLLLIPLLAMIYLYSLRQSKRRLKRFGSLKLMHQLSPMASPRRKLVKFVLAELILTLLILIVARPQIGNKIANNTSREGIEVIMALDISNSMLATDVVPSRLDKSKLMVEGLMNKFTKNKLGLIVFAGDAFVQLPITSDYVSAKMFLDNINPSLIGTQGTDIGKAINLAMHSFTPNTQTGKAIVVITDGEDNEGGAEAMAKQAQEKGIKVFILGIGSTQGTTIPMPNGEDLRDANGNIVKTQLNEEMCKKIADAGHGVYIHVDNSSVADALLEKELGKLQKGEINNVVYSDYDEQFQAFALLAVLSLIIDVFILERKRKY